MLVVPHHAVASYGASGNTESPADNSLSPAHEFIMHLLSGSREFTARQMNNATHLLGVEAIQVRLRQALTGGADEARSDQPDRQALQRQLHPQSRGRADPIVGFSCSAPSADDPAQQPLLFDSTPRTVA